MNHCGVAISFSSSTGEPDDQYAWPRYDGQMPMETAITKAAGSHKVIDNGLGARVLDFVKITSIPVSGSPTTTVAFPLSDAHGNEVATLSRSGTRSYALANQRSYGVWGEVRQGATTGGPRGRYCGQLGHVQDDETGLVYMRARYYEPSSGRFISEDLSANGRNWLIYASNDPISRADRTGNSDINIATWDLWIGEIEECCAISKTAEAIILANLGGCLAWELIVVPHLPNDLKVSFLEDAGGAAFGSSFVPGASIEAQEQAVGDAEVLNLEIAMWVYLDVPPSAYGTAL